MKLLLCVLLSACASEEAPAALPETMAYTCHTKAICDGVEQDLTHFLCTKPSKADVLEVGDSAALDYERLMTAECAAQQGDVEADAPHACPGTYSCDTRCEPMFESCD